METNGYYTTIYSAIRSQSTAVKGTTPSSVNPYGVLAQIQQFVPSVQLAAVNDAIAQISTLTTGSLLSQGTLWAINQYVTTLQNCESAVGSGVVTVGFGIRKREAPFLREAKVCGPAIIAGVLLLGAIFAPEVEVGVLFGTALTAGDFLSIASGLYDLSAAISC